MAVMMMMVVDAAMNVKVDVTKSRDVGRDDGREAAAWLGSALGSRGRREANSRADLDSTSLLLESTLRSLTGAVKYGRMTGPRTRKATTIANPEGGEDVETADYSRPPPLGFTARVATGLEKLQPIAVGEAPETPLATTR
ncbi:unnamed protein product [Lampetra fluviatilis]